MRKTSLLRTLAAIIPDKTDIMETLKKKEESPEKVTALQTKFNTKGTKSTLKEPDDLSNEE